MEKKALGRGLDALLPTTKPAPMPELPEVQHLRIDAVVPNRYQPRQTFSPQELTELAASLKQSGLLQPVLVRRKGDGMYELISGERRWHASRTSRSNASSPRCRCCAWSRPPASSSSATARICWGAVPSTTTRRRPWSSPPTKTCGTAWARATPAAASSIGS